MCIFCFFLFVLLLVVEEGVEGGGGRGGEGGSGRRGGERGDEHGVVVAIGNNKVRMEKLQYLEQLAAPLVSIFHPKAIISARATIGVGSLVMAGAVVGAHAIIGKGCILNPNAVADHDSVMEDFSHLGVGACIPGTARLMKGAWLRAGVSISYGDVVPEWLIAEPYRDFLSKSTT